ncbi:ATP-binding cassette domain-containing protein [Shouchella lehensis]|uniref:Oligopeptide ABC transporter ATP-binding protein n=2 Tax=Shouchella lehensis TaxID=300825 RepID=A0A060LXK0_9BACI|nr:ATP-binding cassette domain-containing protein [Shouchella lehensis]AIC94495.1 oligopeptide ABC transporter ATP-binding protein [Shouchella lehensis G1]TES50384.1 ABC transporter ATP-binding protein [Shouchella lehensis]
MTEPLLKVDQLSKTFSISSKRQNGTIQAVHDVSFSLFKGETLGIVGESGSGKSTIAKMILQLLHPTSGSIYYQGKEISTLSKRERKQMKANVQAVFQDPYASLNPRMKAKEIVTEPLTIHQGLANKDRAERALGLLEEVGLGSQHLNRYPHEFSGGQRQRLSIARAIALKPDVIVCDEAVSALDVSTQAQIVNLLKELQKNHGLSYLFIAHGLPVVNHISDRVAIMKSGELIEIGQTEQIFHEPTEAYTKLLLQAVPPSHPKDRHKTILSEVNTK